MRMALGRFLLWLAGIDSRLVRVKSLGFRLGPYGLEGPVMLVDAKGGGRETIAPVWDAARLRSRLGWPS